MEVSRVEVIICDSSHVELRLYDTVEDERYRSWKIPLSVATVIASWWHDLQTHGTAGKGQEFPNAVIQMPSSSYVYVKERDSLGRTNMVGWGLPPVVVEALTKELSRRQL